MSGGSGAALPTADAEAPCAVDIAATLAAWRAHGAHRVDPVRFRFIEAMATRTSAQQGAARALLEAKVAREVSAYEQRLRPQAAAASAREETAGPGAPGPLAGLVERLEQAAPPATAADAARPGPGDPGAPAELKALRYFRSTWTRLSADQRLSQSLAKVPENAGPLNSHHLVHRSLLLMRELSPEYLNHFMAHVDALMWLERTLGR